MCIGGIDTEKCILTVKGNSFGIQSCHLLCKCTILCKIVFPGSAIFDWLHMKLHDCLYHSKPTATRD